MIAKSGRRERNAANASAAAATRAALGLLVARTAIGAGHDVSVFLAGDGVHLLVADTADGVVGLGTGAVREHLEAIVEGGGALFASARSCEARGIAADAWLPAVPAPPDRLVALMAEADRVLVY